jgi:molybdenum-dependent oxidoreductase-like protein
MKQPKWIDSMEAIDAWEPGYWVRRGWDREARMRATSVIDTLAMDMMIIESGKSTMISVGGIAHAGARGISRVEVSVDEGPWEPAMLRDPMSPTTWVIWRYDWPFQSGKHAFTVRCFEGDGTPQIAVESPIGPSGATGLDRVTRML